MYLNCSDQNGNNMELVVAKAPTFSSMKDIYMRSVKRKNFVVSALYAKNV